MRDKILEVLVGRVLRTHSLIQRMVQDLNAEELSFRPSLISPPIGWHVWHIVRWADCFQASFSDSMQVWDEQNLREQFGLVDIDLGPMQTGVGMSDEDAANIPMKIGKTDLFTYMETVFETNKHALMALKLDDFYRSRESMVKWEIVGGKPIKAQGKQVALIEDFGLHITHANRHLGMIEALIGATLERSGSASL